MQIVKFTYRLFPGWVRWITQQVPDPRTKAKCDYSMEQVFFCGLMLFVLRYRSLRSFCLENKITTLHLETFKDGSQSMPFLAMIRSDIACRQYRLEASIRLYNNFMRKVSNSCRRRGKYFILSRSIADHSHKPKSRVRPAAPI